MKKRKKIFLGDNCSIERVDDINKAFKELEAPLVKKMIPREGPEKPKEEKPSQWNLKIVYGKNADIHTSSEVIPCKYALMELDSLITSNNWENYNKNEKYPPACQERTYHIDKAEQLKVENTAKNLETALLLTDDPTPENGAAIVTNDGIVLGGNGRTMSLKRAFAYYGEKWEKYQLDLRDRLQNFGIPETSFRMLDKPVLVRVIDVNMNKCSHYSWILNTSLKQEANLTQRALAYSKDIKPEALEQLGTILQETDVETFSQILDNPSICKKLINILRDNGIINDHNVSQWLESESYKFTTEGRIYIETILIGSILNDKQVIEAAKNYTNKIIKAIPYFLRIKRLKGKFNIIPEFEKAIKLESERKNSNMRKADFRNQDSMFGEKPSELTMLVWDLLDMSIVKFKKVMRAYADSAEQQADESASFFGKEKIEPEELLKKLMDRAESLKDLINETPIFSKMTTEKQSALSDFVRKKSIWEKIGKEISKDPLVKFIKDILS